MTMDNLNTLRSLLERVEKATGEDREIDLAIIRFFRPDRALTLKGERRCKQVLSKP